MWQTPFQALPHINSFTVTRPHPVRAEALPTGAQQLAGSRKRGCAGLPQAQQPVVPAQQTPLAGQGAPHSDAHSGASGQGCLHARRPSEGAPAPSSSLSCPRSMVHRDPGNRSRGSGSQDPRHKHGGRDSLNLPTPEMGGRSRPSFHKQGREQRKIRMRPLFNSHSDLCGGDSRARAQDGS